MCGRASATIADEPVRGPPAYSGIEADNVFLGVGSDEAIDCLIRIFCVPGRDAVMIAPPTYGMYKVAACINDVAVQAVPLSESFQLRVDAMLDVVTEHTKLIFLCSPNNPSGNAMARRDMIALLESPFRGAVVVDEAYVDFSPHGSLAPLVRRYGNLIVLQTLSKAFGLAGVRLGWAIAAADVVAIMNKVKAPYNVNKLTASVAMRAFDRAAGVADKIASLLAERERLRAALEALPSVRRVFASDANFLLVRIDRAPAVYRRLADDGVICRYRGAETHCTDCIRITVGTAEQNATLVAALRRAVAAGP